MFLRLMLIVSVLVGVEAVFFFYILVFSWLGIMWHKQLIQKKY